MLRNRFNRHAYASFIKTDGRKTDPDTLIEGMLASGGDIMALVNDMHAAAYTGGVAEADFGRLLFSPSTTDIRQLPPAILDTKEALPPADLMPTTKAELEHFLRRLMVATGEEANIDILVAGWSTGQSPGLDFNLHVEQLWQLRREEQALHAALVGGRFGSVVRHLQQRPSIAGETRRVRDLLVAQALIWCAHDVQLVATRMTHVPVYGHLLLPSRSAEGALNHLRDHRAALNAILDIFFGSDDWRFGDIEPVWSGMNTSFTEHKDALIRRAAKRIVPRGHELEARLSLADVTAMMQQVAAKVRSDAFLARIDTPRTCNVGAKTYAADWYGLPPLAAASVAIRRLIQAEQQLPELIDAVIAGKASPATSILKPLPAYADMKSRHRSSDRLDELVAFYREAVLADNNDSTYRPWKATGAARDFLVARGARQLDDHHGPAGDPRRAFYLLDVIPEHRFTVG